MRDWTMMLGGLIVWAIHFFALYGFASVFPGSDLARGLTLAATVPALGSDVVLLWLAARHRLKATSGSYEGWVADITAVGSLLSFIAILWQALPALIV